MRPDLLRHGAILGVVLALTGCGGGNGGNSESPGETLSTDSEAGAELAQIETALARLNIEEGKAILVTVSPEFEALGGTVRCGVGFSAESPGQVLVTVARVLPPDVNSWAQLAVHPQNGIDVSTVESGPDAELAGIDEAFWSSLYPCEIVAGNIVLAAG